MGNAEYLYLIDNPLRESVVLCKPAFRKYHERIVEFRLRLLYVHFQGIARFHLEERIVDVLRDNLPVSLFIHPVKIYYHTVEKELHLNFLKRCRRTTERIVQCRHCRLFPEDFLFQQYSFGRVVAVRQSVPAIIHGYSISEYRIFESLHLLHFLHIPSQIRIVRHGGFAVGGHILRIRDFRGQIHQLPEIINVLYRPVYGHIVIFEHVHIDAVRRASPVRREHRIAPVRSVVEQYIIVRGRIREPHVYRNTPVPGLFVPSRDIQVIATHPVKSGRREIHGFPVVGYDGIDLIRRGRDLLVQQGRQLP